MPGTLRNLDGTLKDPADQLEQIEQARRRGALIEDTSKSQQKLKNNLRLNKPYDPSDYDH